MPSKTLKQLCAVTPYQPEVEPDTRHKRKVARIRAKARPIMQSKRLVGARRAEVGIKKFEPVPEELSVLGSALHPVDTPPTVDNPASDDPDKAALIEIITEISDSGISLREACTVHGYPFRRAVKRIFSDPELSALDEKAREHFLIFSVRRMNDIVSLEPDVARAKLLCDNLKWEASRVAPKRYGDKMMVAGDANAPLVHMHMQLAADADELIKKIKGEN